MHAQRKSIRQISLDWSRDLRAGRQPFYGDLGNLLDDFRERCESAQERVSLICDTPESTGQPETDAYLAALTESLCQEAGLRPPAWTQHESYYLKRPWFAGGLESLKAILLAESPAAFRRRNLFVSANALSRA